MRFYNHTHAFYAGVDLHARSMFTHVLDSQGATVFAKDLPGQPQAFLDAVALYRVGVECMFAWYWLADLCGCREIADCEAFWKALRSVTKRQGKAHPDVAVEEL